MLTALCLFIFLFFSLQLTVAGYNYFKKIFLTSYVDESFLKISVLVPARNEEKNLSKLLESLSGQSYNNFEVNILDDSSVDDTYNIANKYISRFKELSVIKGLPLPAGWTGKNYACAQLASNATGDYYLFLDADIVAEQNLLSSLAYAMQLDQLALLSIVPQQFMLTLGERTTVPLMSYMLLTLLPLPLIFEHEMPVFSAACGQVMCFDAISYDKQQFHSKLRNQVVEEDVKNTARNF